MTHPVRGSSRSNESNAPHPQVILAPLPSRDQQHNPNVSSFDLYDGDYAGSQMQSPHPMNAPAGAGPSSPPVAGGWNHQQQQQYYSQESDSDGIKVPVPLDLDLGALSLNDHHHQQQQQEVGSSSNTNNHEDTESSADLTSLPLRFSDPEDKKPVERTGYADDTRYSGSDQGHVPATSTVDGAAADSASASFEPGVVLNNQTEGHSPHRTDSVDSSHSAVRAYAAANPNAATYSESPSSHAAVGGVVGGAGGYGAHPGYGGYEGQDYGYNGAEHQQPHQRPPFRGPPQPGYGQFPPHDPRYQQHYPPGGPAPYGGNGYQQGGYGQDPQYDQYGQPSYAGSEYGGGQEYYQDPNYPPQHHYGAGGGYHGGPGNGYEYGGGYRPQGPPSHGYPPQQYYPGGPGGPGGANLHSSPSMRGPPPGRGGPRPMGGPPGYGGGVRPPHRGDSGSSMASVRSNVGPGGGPVPKKRPLTIELLDEMRQRAKTSNDPSAQLEYAKALIEAAVTFGNDDPDPKRQKKNKEALFMEGLKIIKRLATTGMGMGKPAYPDAQFFLANCYGNGSLGLQIDHDKAFNLYIQASKQNHPAATYRTAVCHELGAGTKRDHSRAVQFYRKAASLGDTAAMYKLGMVILKGLLGQQSNPREAITWLKRAAANADEDNPHALHELGLCFEKAGIPSVIPDEAYSRELFTQAAGYGYAPSQFKLGHCYEYGLLTCPVDPRRSIAWYTRAAEQGDAESELGLSGWYLTGSEGVLKQSDTEAYLWARKAADKGLARAEYAVGYYSEVGIGVKQDLDEARRWYLRSAAQGNGRAKKRLTDMKKLGAMRRVRPERGRQNGQGPEDENCKVM
ncbi:hypothetical protein EDD11_004732 [Mortierella claussenii]|nr:hypothetical protein EDD11_004732 [Mortierella claussenii]